MDEQGEPVPAIVFTPNLDLNPWTELHGTGPTELALTRVGVMPNGTKSQRAVVWLHLVTPDGEVMLCQTTLRLFLTIAAATAACPVAQLEEM